MRVLVRSGQETWREIRGLALQTATRTLLILQNDAATRRGLHRTPGAFATGGPGLPNPPGFDLAKRSALADPNLDFREEPGDAASADLEPLREFASLL